MADWVGLEGPTRMGQLTADPVRGKEVFAFEYDKEWLSTASRQQLDPSMALYAGPQYPANSRENFGVFLDSCPDRWGRVLMRRREAQLARAEGRAETSPKRLVSSCPRRSYFDSARRAVATSHGLPRTAQDRMGRAFRVAEAWGSG